MSTRELYEISRMLELILEALGIDKSMIYPKGYFVVMFKGVELYGSRDYWECLDYMQRCGTLSEPYLVKRLDGKPEIVGKDVQEEKVLTAMEK